MLTVTGSTTTPSTGRSRWSTTTADSREIRQFAVEEINDAIDHFDGRWSAVEGDRVLRVDPTWSKFAAEPFLLNHPIRSSLDELLAETHYVLTDPPGVRASRSDRQTAAHCLHDLFNGAQTRVNALLHPRGPRRLSTERAVVVGQIAYDIRPHPARCGSGSSTSPPLASPAHGRITHDDMFEEGDLDAAMARFHELDVFGVVLSGTADEPEVGFDPWRRSRGTWTRFRRGPTSPRSFPLPHPVVSVRRPSPARLGIAGRRPDDRAIPDADRAARRRGRPPGTHTPLRRDVLLPRAEPLS